MQKILKNLFLFKVVTTFIIATFLVLFITNAVAATNKTTAKTNNNYNKQSSSKPIGVVVIMTDFGIKDGAVASMKGVVTSVSKDLKIFDLTNEIPEYNIWEASYRWYQTVPYWPSGTVFISVVDPGVGQEGLPVVAKAENGQYFVTPNNGTLTMINDTIGIEEVRMINQAVNRLQNSEQSYTFFGRDVYALTAAKLAARQISFKEVGKKIPLDQVVLLKYKKPVNNNGVITGTIPVLDVQYGNVWSNIPLKLFKQLNPQFGETFKVKIMNNNKVIYKGVLPYCNTFSAVKPGEALIYINSLLELSVGLNMDSFAIKYKVNSGNTWSITISR